MAENISLGMNSDILEQYRQAYQNGNISDFLKNLDETSKNILVQKVNSLNDEEQNSLYNQKDLLSDSQQQLLFNNASALTPEQKASIISGNSQEELANRAAQLSLANLYGGEYIDPITKKVTKVPGQYAAQLQNEQAMAGTNQTNSLAQIAAQQQGAQALQTGQIAGQTDIEKLREAATQKLADKQLEYNTESRDFSQNAFDKSQQLGQQQQQEAELSLASLVSADNPALKQVQQYTRDESAKQQDISLAQLAKQQSLSGVRGGQATSQAAEAAGEYGQKTQQQLNTQALTDYYNRQAITAKTQQQKQAGAQSAAIAQPTKQIAYSY